MDTAIGNISYKYRAPLRYIFFSAGFLCAGGLASFFFAVVEPWVFRAIILFIMIVAFSGGLAFLISFLRNLSGQIVFAQDYAVLPCREKKRRVVLEYSDITGVKETDTTHGRLLKISTADGSGYVLDENWMCKAAFDDIAETFREKAGKKY